MAIDVPIRPMGSEVTPIEPVNEGEGDTNVVEIDGVEYELDADGNAVKDGQIFMPKEEISKLTVTPEESDDTSTDEEDELDINSIAKELNLEFTDNEGKPISFEPTKEGLVQFVQAVFETGVNTATSSAREQMIKQYPELENVINYIVANGSLNGYDSSNVDYMTMTLDKNNQNQLISIVRKSRELKGDSETEINKFISLVTSDGSLYDIAQSSLTHLQNIVKQSNEQTANKAKQAEDAQREQYQNYIASVSNTIKQGLFKVGDKEIPIPVQFKVTNDEGQIETRTKEQFLEYMLQEKEFKLKDGNVIKATQFEVDKFLEQHQLGYSKDIYDAMRLFTKGDLTSVIDKSVESRRVQDVKKKVRFVSKSTGTPTTGKNVISKDSFPVAQRVNKTF